MKKRYATLTQKRPDFFLGGKWFYETDSFQVEVMAVSGKWAMCRRSRCVPFVAETKDLSTTDIKGAAP